MCPNDVAPATAPEARRITVLHVCEHFGGEGASLHGVGRAFQWWLPAFDAARFRVLLCSRKGRDKAGAVMEAAGVQPLYLSTAKYDPRSLTRLLRIARRERVDILHAHGFGASLWARLVGMLLRLPVIVHGRCNYGSVPWIMRPVERLLGPRTLHAFAVSESTRAFTIRCRHIPAERVEVLYNGFPMSRVERIAPARQAALRAEQGATPATTVFGIVGRLVSHKGHLDAFAALEPALREGRDAQVWVVGDGEDRAALEAWARERQAGWIRFLGFRADARDVMQALDVLLLPSHMEGTPNTLFEAMALERAVIATRADGQGEILRHGETALLYDAGDVATLAQHARALIDDPAQRRRLAGALGALTDRFDGRHCIAGMERAYERLAGRA